MHHGRRNSIGGYTSFPVTVRRMPHCTAPTGFPAHGGIRRVTFEGVMKVILFAEIDNFTCCTFCQACANYNQVYCNILAERNKQIHAIQEKLRLAQEPLQVRP